MRKQVVLLILLIGVIFMLTVSSGCTKQVPVTIVKQNIKIEPCNE